MSWDIFVQDLPDGAKAVSDIPDDFEPRALGSRAEVIQRILAVVPNAVFTRDSWGSVEGPEFSIDFNLGSTDEVQSFALHVRGGDAAAGLVSDLLERCQWRALDPSSDSGIFEARTAVESLRRWRAYRDQVLAPKSAG